MSLSLLIWPIFVVFVLALLALDLGVFHRKAHAPSVAEALAWSAFWICLALAFNALVFFLYENNWIGGGLAFPEDVSGRQAALEFFTGYVLEKSLSLDNIFVIALIFSYFQIPLKYQHRVLFWGVVGALVMRGAMIAVGALMIERFAWTTYLFGAVLLVTAARMMVVRHDNLEPEKNPLVKLVRRLYPVTDDLRGERFFVVEKGRTAATPLLLVLLMVEATDVLFAVDSIPAIFAVTHDPFLVYTSNVFAILGLRSLYFALAPLLAYFRFLKMSLTVILAFVGVKMLLAHHRPIPVLLSLGVLLSILFVGVLASLIWPTPHDGLRSPVEDELDRLFRFTRRVVARCTALALGGSLVVVGTLFILIPGLGIKVILAGLALLAPQFVWARKLLVLGEGLSGRTGPGERPPPGDG